MKYLLYAWNKIIMPFRLTRKLVVAEAEKWQGGITIDALLMDNLIFGSDYLRQKFGREGIHPPNVHVVHYGVDLSKFYFEERSTNNSRNYKLLFVGRLTAGKGVHVLLEAIKILNSGGDSGRVHELTIIGEGEEEYTQSLVNYIRDNRLEKYVTLCDKASREFISRSYHQHDLFVFPSLWEEPFGIVIVEAMASGIPVVGTGVGGSCEILQDGINSLVCKPDDSQDLAAKIVQILSNDALREELVLNAHNNVKLKFTQQKTIDAIENVIIGLVNREH